MKPTFLTYQKPLLCAMVQDSTPAEMICTIMNSQYDGAEAFGIQLRHDLHVMHADQGCDLSEILPERGHGKTCCFFIDPRAFRDQAGQIFSPRIGREHDAEGRIIGGKVIEESGLVREKAPKGVTEIFLEMVIMRRIYGIYHCVT